MLVFSKHVFFHNARFRHLFLETLRPEPVARAQNYLRKLEVGLGNQFGALTAVTLCDSVAGTIE